MDRNSDPRGEEILSDHSSPPLSLLFQRVVPGAMVRLSVNATVRLLGIVRIVIFARLFLPEEIGTASLAVTFAVTLAILANFGFVENVLRSRSDSRDFGDTAFTLSVITAGPVWMIILVGGVVTPFLFSVDLQLELVALSVLAFTIPVQFPRTFWERELRFLHPSIALVLQEATIILGAVLLQSLWSLGAWSLIISQVAAFLALGGYLWIMIPRRPKIQISRELVPEMRRFGVPFMLHQLNGRAAAIGDNLMVGAFLGPSQFAYYNFAWQLPSVISGLAAAVDTVLLPIYGQVRDNLDSTRKIFNLANKMWSIFGAFFGFPLIIFSEEIVHLLYGPRWDPAIPLLEVMSVSFIIRFCTGYGYDNLALSRGRTSYLMKWGVVNTILLFTVGQMFIIKMGAIGGAYFWLAQAVCLIPVVRLPLIYQELRTLEYVAHVWQPLLAGLAGYLAVAGARRLALFQDAPLVLEALIYIGVFVLTLLVIDRNLVSIIKRIRSGALKVGR